MIEALLFREKYKRYYEKQSSSKWLEHRRYPKAYGFESRTVSFVFFSFTKI